jgi:FKBP-type peptidyl-prolyl cis-trans isomerase
MRKTSGPPALLACLLAVAGCKKSSNNPPAPATKEVTPSMSPVDPNAPADVTAPPPDADQTGSGLASKVLKAGSGTLKPGPTDMVNVHYTGWMTDGRKFDSSVDRGQPAKFPLNAVIKGWTEGVQLMVEGEKRRFWIPANLAYGETPRRPGGPHGMLVFDVELLSIIRPPGVPEDVAAPPSSAKKTKSGLLYRVLTNGTGTEHPKASSVVEVHYSGWTKDGKMFDSSVTRGEPASFPLNGVIPGWTEGVQLMVVGEKTRFWIPGEMAYGETPSRPGAPAGMLVFDIELLSFR